MLAEEPGDSADLHFPLDSGRNSHNSQNSGESFASSAARSTSINLDARSDISEATTVSIVRGCLSNFFYLATVQVHNNSVMISGLLLKSCFPFPICD